MRLRLWSRVAPTVCLLLWALTPAWSQIAVSPEGVTAGEPVSLWVMGLGVPVDRVLVTVIYRPGSQVEERLELGRTTDTGELVWVPVRPGLVRVRAEIPQPDPKPPVVHTRDLAVRFTVVPRWGLGILLVAGMLLFGGVTLGLRRALSR